jgi:hypothetical protein
MEDVIDLSDFPVEVVRVGSRYACVILKLLLSASDDDLQAAYTAVCAKRDKLLNDAQAAGVLDRFHALAPDPLSQPSAKNNGSLGSFSIRVSIVTLAAALLLVLAGAVVSTASRRVVDVFASRFEAMSPFSMDWDKRMNQVEDWLYQAASPHNQPTPEQEAKMRENLRTLVTRMRPYVDELAPLVERQRSVCEASCPPAASPGK